MFNFILVAPVPDVHKEYTPEDVAASGAVLLQTARILADR